MVVKRRGENGPAEGAGPLSSSVNTNYLKDPRMEKGRAQTASKLDGMKGPSNKDIKQERKADIQRRMAKESQKVSWKKQLGTLAAVLLICGAGLFQFLSTVWGFMQGSGVTNIDIRDTAQLKAVLFSGEPWLVYCVNNETATQRLPKVLEDSAVGLYSSLGVKTGVLGCWDATESGRSVAQRFKLNLKPPLSFFVTNGNKPRKISLVGLSKVEDIEKKLKPAMKLETSRIDTLKKWPSLCTSRKTCVVIGHKNSAQRDFALKLFKPLQATHRAARIVTLDTAFWQLKLGDAVMETRGAKAKGKGADVLCLSRDSAEGNATHSGVFLQDLDATSAESFMQACEVRSGLVKLEATPRIKARPSKPRKVTPPSPSPRPSPPPPASKPREPTKGNVDRVGSREALENEEAAFEAVDEEDSAEESGEEDEDQDDGEEIEL